MASIKFILRNYSEYFGQNSYFNIFHFTNATSVRSYSFLEGLKQCHDEGRVGRAVVYGQHHRHSYDGLWSRETQRGLVSLSLQK